MTIFNSGGRDQRAGDAQSEQTNGRSSGPSQPRSMRLRNTVAGIAVAVVTAFAVAIATGAGSTAWDKLRSVLGLDDGAGTAVASSRTPDSSTTSGSQTPQVDPTETRRPRGTGYPNSAGDYCNEFVRAWQDGYKDRALDLSNQSVINIVWANPAPRKMTNAWGPAASGAVCRILDPDRGNALVVELTVGGQTTKPNAITAARMGAS